MKTLGSLPIIEDTTAFNEVNPDIITKPYYTTK